MNTNDLINEIVASSIEFRGECKAVKAQRACKSSQRSRESAIAALAAADAIAASAVKVGPATINLDVSLVLGDLLADRTKSAVVFDVIGYPCITLSRAKLRQVAVELLRTKRRGAITCQLGGGLTFAWRTGHLTLRDQEPRNIPGIGCVSSIARMGCHHKHPLTPDNSIRVVIGGMQ